MLAKFGPIRTCAIALGVAAAFSSAASADIVGSTSNDPSQAINPSVIRLVTSDHTSLSRLSAKRLKKIATPVGSRTAPRPSGLILDPYQLAAMPPATGGQQWQCLTEALYFEARGETLKGQVAVAEVILNRMNSNRFPNTVCGVVGQSNRNGCQFSYRCDGRPETMSDRQARAQVGKVARMMLDGAPRTLAGGATYYHASWVRPKWSRVFRRTASHGVHIFYRPS